MLMAIEPKRMSYAGVALIAYCGLFTKKERLEGKTPNL
jgi:hypothetical protein